MNNSGTGSRYRFVIGALILWAHFAAALSFQVVAPILPLITEDYKISHATAGLLVAVVLIIHGAFGIPGGIIVGRLGVRRIYALCWFLTGTLTLSALSPGFEGLLGLRILYGLGLAAMFPATGVLIMQWFRPAERAFVTSAGIAFFALGLVISISTAAPLSDVLGWPRVLGIFGSFSLVGAFAWLVWGKGQGGEANVDTPMAWSEIRGVLRNRTVLILAAADTACFSMYTALATWLPTFYHETRGMSLTEAGFITSLLPFVGIFAVLLGGFLSLKVKSKRLFFILPGVMAGVGGFGSFLIDNNAVTYISVVIFGLGAWLYVPTLLTLSMGLPGMTPRGVAIAWGVIVTLSGIGSFIAPLAVGALRDSLDSFIPGFLIFAVLAWFLFVSGFLLPKAETLTGPSPGPAESTMPVQERHEA